MKKFMKVLLVIVIVIIVLAGYYISFNFFGNKEKTITNKPIVEDYSVRPRLEDDFYTYINYDFLKNSKLDEEDGKFAKYYTFDVDKTKKEKNKFIDELINENSSVGKKAKIIYDEFMNNNEEDSLKVLNTYIDKINSSKNIEEYLNNIIDINYELSTSILFNVDMLFNFKDNKDKKIGFNLSLYDWNEEIGYYSIDEGKDFVRMYKKYDIMLLKKYGYSDKEALEITKDVQKMYKELCKFAELNQNVILEKGFNTYKIEDLKKEYKNIPFDQIFLKYKQYLNKDKEIIIVDINQIHLINDYLKEENLDTLKKEAMLKILTKYCSYISDDYAKIELALNNEKNNSVIYKEKSKEDVAKDIIYRLFSDSVVEKFANEHFSKEQKDFYTELIREEIEVYKKRIMEEDWLTKKTKENAIKKMENLKITVGISDDLVKIENKYKVNKDDSYISNIIGIRQNIKNERIRQVLKNNKFYGETDQLEFNAYYNRVENSINLLLGYIYNLTETLNLGKNNLKDNYYPILGSVGATIGHELSHALDNNGRLCDEYGNFVDWWTKEDEKRFNEKISKVVKHYNRYNQYGDKTLGENIADLGGVSIILEIAKNKNANNKDYIDIFENFTKNWGIKKTKILSNNSIKMDEHSPDKNRVNAVLPNFEEFYKTYNIKYTDKMYIKPENRVSVW